MPLPLPQQSNKQSILEAVHVQSLHTHRGSREGFMPCCSRGRRIKGAGALNCGWVVGKGC
jgi:hypothetical protein